MLHFYHVPKTAGRALTRAIYQALVGKDRAEQAEEQTHKACPKPLRVGRYSFLAHTSKVPYWVMYSFGHHPMWRTRLRGPQLRITILRDPYSRVISRLRHLNDLRARGEHNPHKHLPEFVEFAAAPSTEHWARHMPDRWLKQQLYIFSKRFKPKVAARAIGRLQCVLRTETFGDDLRMLGKRLRLPLQARVVNASVTPIQLSPETETLLRHRLEPEYELMELVANKGMGE